MGFGGEHWTLPAGEKRFAGPHPPLLDHTPTAPLGTPAAYGMASPRQPPVACVGTHREDLTALTGHSEAPYTGTLSAVVHPGVF